MKLYPGPEVIKESFSFLEELGFKVTTLKTGQHGVGAIVEFVGNGKKIHLNFEYKEYYFWFKFYHRDDINYSDEAVGKDIIPFSLLENASKFGELQPNEVDGYEIALKNNVELLRSFLSTKNV